MHRTRKYLAFALVLMVSAVILVFALRKSRTPTTGFNVQVATNTCSCYPDSPRILVLHISSRGGLALNSEAVPNGQLPGRLRQIYGTRAERVLYLFPENDTPSQRIADVIDVVQHLQSEKTLELPVPEELQMKAENMNIQIRLVTSGALSAPCPKDCFNWATQGIPLAP
jgi:biopolymer transport protein ExbD